jgi:hypothetical protein
VARGRKEIKRLAYLALRAVPAADSVMTDDVQAGRATANLVSAWTR